MNPMLWPTLGFAGLLFWAGMIAKCKLSTNWSKKLFLAFSAVVALPGILFASYHTRPLGEPVRLCQFRVIPSAELTAAGFGLFAGFIHQGRDKHPFLKRQIRAATVPAILALIIGAPYVKPIIRPPGARQLRENWRDGVCIQSTLSTCGPASAATIARALGKPATEADLARESLGCAGGAENWYLARALRRRGVTVGSYLVEPDSKSFPTPAVAEVKLAQGTGHFLALMTFDGTNCVGNDPLTGRSHSDTSRTHV